MQIKHTIYTCIPKVNSTCCLKNDHVMHVGSLSKNNKNYKIIVPRWRFKSFLSYDLSTSKRNAKISHNIAIMTIRWPTHVPLHPNIRLLINQWWYSNIKGRKKWTKHFWVGRNVLSCLLTFKNKHTPNTFKTNTKHFQNMKYFQKSNTLYTFLRTRTITKFS